MAAAYAAGFLTALNAVRMAYYRGNFCKLGRSPNVDCASGTATLKKARGHFGSQLTMLPRSVILNGGLVKVRKMQNLLSEKKNVSVRMLRVVKAYHSPRISVFGDALREVWHGISSRDRPRDQRAKRLGVHGFHRLASFDQRK
ncbi:hypothetical protein MGG_16787 [Pyricularia oryzae 70-15]|uniref:Uncharacterized protein n=1 Tax=Pyricularia oryzae (strain 70-15 / ATCC MYA-4617 / FGSC 8958) TaxID=242507 RepID=G4N0W7_PYRO7|nr:uncharacterized protein MGG_16787 [Pyricularia oryzae 70-15]EHA52345.1 hypothetical protein MGG_16787 [Pyricularia oryzae 70-15]